MIFAVKERSIISNHTILAIPTNILVLCFRVTYYIYCNVLYCILLHCIVLYVLLYQIVGLMKMSMSHWLFFGQEYIKAHRKTVKYVLLFYLTFFTFDVMRAFEN